MISVKEAIALQQQMRNQVILTPPTNFQCRYVAGADVSYSRKNSLFFAAIVVLDYPEMKLEEVKTAQGTSDFPYIPGLLSFREAPILIQAFKRLNIKPDVILVDGQGIAHPRRLGLATHLGILLQIPTIGCAKSRLVGRYEPVPEIQGGFSILQENGEQLGLVLRSRQGVKPIFISPGHLMDIKTAYEIVLNCLKGYRLPEPTRLSHIEANKARTSIEKLSLLKSNFNSKINNQTF